MTASPSRLPDCPNRLWPLLQRCATGEVSAAVTLMHLLIEEGCVERVAQTVDEALIQAETRSRRDADGAEAIMHRLRQLRDLIADHGPGLHRIAAMLQDGLDHEQRGAASPESDIDRFRAMFDRLARQSPEASVALYSLGSPDLLDQATAEVVETMRHWDLIAPDRRLLEIGCGIGRFQVALADAVKAITGIDISGEMIAIARQRCAALKNVHLTQCSGRDLSLFGSAAFDLVFAVDSFPYLMQAGIDLVERHVHEAARVLATGGDLLILNFSYRGDVEADRTDIARLAAASGFAVMRNGIPAFALWDGLAFHLTRTARRDRLPR